MEIQSSIRKPKKPDSLRDSGPQFKSFDFRVKPQICSFCAIRVYGMGQLAGSRKTPLAMTFFGESLIKTITTLEIWRTQVKLAILAQEGINLDVLFNQKPTTVTLPPESHYEQPIDNPTEVTK